MKMHQTRRSFSENKTKETCTRRSLVMFCNKRHVITFFSKRTVIAACKLVIAEQKRIICNVICYVHEEIASFRRPVLKH